MSKKKDTSSMIEAAVSGMPCFANPETVTIVPPWGGSAHTCPSADDYYGYTEVEFTLYDRKGYRAKWLEAKLTDDEISEIEDAIVEAEVDRVAEYEADRTDWEYEQARDRALEL